MPPPPRSTNTILSSNKRPVMLSFDDISHRLFDMSFDPYNCVELRWGGDGMGCPDQAGKRRYYAMEAQARRAIDPNTGAVAGPADTDIRGLILFMSARAPWVQRMPGDPRQFLLP
ncbi:MAG: hypothetical protein NTX21_11595 [Alphaproteobacteria bacterium]|nr:hypothetical protein [Alphaproteobacteria bacterium]